ncbi:MAG: cryptochrome/photolyase family protein [Halococcoides sp.]
MTVWVLGDQLTDRAGPVAERDNAVLVIESTAFGGRLPYHPHKLQLVVAAMRAFRDRLRADGRTVHYYQVERFADGLAAHATEHPGDHLRAITPPTHGARDRMATLAAEVGLSIAFEPDPRFLCDPAAFDEWAGDRKTYRHEAFYRWMRDRTGILMDEGEPLGGAYNYDDQNRETPPADWSPPPIPAVRADGHADHTDAAAEWAAAVTSDDWGAPAAFQWPTTRDGALDVLDAFVADRLGEFGPYQDAMRSDSWAMAHSLLSPALNLGLLGPREVIDRVVDGRDDAPLVSVEGFVRQVLGWREFLRHVYRREMPALAAANQLDATLDLPPAYWTGETDMACLADVVEGVRRRGYAHHIERLMVLSNVATLLGVRPQALNRWFHAAFVDAFHWVTTPNVIGMGTFGTDQLSTKPYVTSANYVDRMSDYCAGCAYDRSATLGADACPLNTLYWDFLDRHEDRLRSNHRMGLVYSHLDDRRDELSDIRDRADRLQGAALDGSL